MVHPPDQSLPPLGDEVLLEAAGGLLLRQVGHRDDGETLHEPSVQPVEVFIPAGMIKGKTRGRNYVDIFEWMRREGEGLVKKSK